MSADVVGALQAALQTRFPNDRAVTELPGDLVAAAPCHQIARLGGPRELSLDAARISIQTVDVTPLKARLSAERLIDFMQYQLPGMKIGGAAITRVTVDSGPAAIDGYPNPNVRMVVTSYTVHTLTVG